jgi:hypothetical protein
MVLLRDGIYDVRCSDDFMWHDILMKFHKDWYRHSSNNKVLPQQSEWLKCWYYSWIGIISALLRWIQVA